MEAETLLEKNRGDITLTGGAVSSIALIQRLLSNENRKRLPQDALDHRILRVPTTHPPHPNPSIVYTYVDDGKAAIEVVLTATEVGEEEAVVG